MVYNTMIPVYSFLVETGAYALTASDNPKNLPIIPSQYISYVAEYLAQKEAKKNVKSAV